MSSVVAGRPALDSKEDAGVGGGLIGFGIVGLFIGPEILAATCTLLESWIKEGTKGAS